MVILTALCAYTDQGLPLPSLNANDSYLRLEGESRGCTFFDVLRILFVIVFVYPLPIDSLMSSLTGSLELGLLVVA